MFKLKVLRECFTSVILCDGQGTVRQASLHLDRSCCLFLLMAGVILKGKIFFLSI